MKKANVKEMILLLQKKIAYLQDFQNLNREEWTRINQGNLENIEDFYYDRELLLNAMERIDKKLQHYKVDQCEGVTQKSKNKIIFLLQKKRKAIHHIVNQDMKIHDHLHLVFAEKNKSA